MSIVLDKVSYEYGQNTVLDAITATIDQGEFVSIIGPNGGGKTTLLKLIIGLLQPGNGTITIDGEPVHRKQQDIGYVPQVSQHDNRFPISVLDVVKTGLLTKDPLLRNKNVYDQCMQALETVGLSDAAAKPIYALSGGQKQRVLIARALAGSPSYLFLDEPTSNVDTVINEQLHQLLKKLSGQRTILLVTHDYSLVSSLSTRVFCINRHLHEHPIEDTMEEAGHDIYGNRVMRVRHDIVLNEDACFCEQHLGGHA
ncbi:MAG: metal ABC transporter ATP-binding protein [Spirochaetia bacterium]|nr:metal ABC transporter ATP-binding protein [Spirochaetia bacterium]MCF7940100.1 metal ABC transporter ATP-binding protein [Spirochaetia bacterium]